jgi:hypothetical protein
MLTRFKSLGQNGLTLNHYNLADVAPEYTPQEWKEFLFDTEVYDWIQSELSVIQSSELNKMLQNISDSHSVGQAQIISALAKLTENKTNKTQEGPIFIYTYVPLNPEQAQAENVSILNKDPFAGE